MPYFHPVYFAIVLRGAGGDHVLKREIETGLFETRYRDAFRLVLPVSSFDSGHDCSRVREVLVEGEDGRRIRGLLDRLNG